MKVRMSVLKVKVLIGAVVAVLGLYLLFTYLWRDQFQFELIDLSEDGQVNHNASSVVSIDWAHTMGKRHRGVWLHIVNERNELLLMKRSDKAITCPSSWNAPGEHTMYLEPYIDTAYRGLSEEMGLERNQILSITPLTKAPMLLEILYGPPLQKHDAQWTQSFLVHVLKASIGKDNAEASAMEWIPIAHIEDRLKMGDLHFCQVSKFTYTSKELGAEDARGTDFQGMLLMHTRIIRGLEEEEEKEKEKIKENRSSAALEQ